VPLRLRTSEPQLWSAPLQRRIQTDASTPVRRPIPNFHPVVFPKWNLAVHYPTSTTEQSLGEPVLRLPVPTHSTMGSHLPVRRRSLPVVLLDACPPWQPSRSVPPRHPLAAPNTECPGLAR